MSLFTKKLVKAKKFIRPKEPKKMKSPKIPSKPTLSTSKNIFSVQSQKLREKIGYHDSYLDLVNSQKAKKCIFQKKYPKRKK